MYNVAAKRVSIKKEIIYFLYAYPSGIPQAVKAEITQSWLMPLKVGNNNLLPTLRGLLPTVINTTKRRHEVKIHIEFISTKYIMSVYVICI